nr:uncharacterized protein LOC105861154 [Microcebus murinus]
MGPDGPLQPPASSGLRPCPAPGHPGPSAGTFSWGFPCLPGRVAGQQCTPGTAAPVPGVGPSQLAASGAELDQTVARESSPSGASRPSHGAAPARHWGLLVPAHSSPPLPALRAPAAPALAWARGTVAAGPSLLCPQPPFLLSFFFFETEPPVTLSPRLGLNSWAQAILPLWPSKVPELRVCATAPRASRPDRQTGLLVRGWLSCIIIKEHHLYDLMHLKFLRLAFRPSSCYVLLRLSGVVFCASQLGRVCSAGQTAVTPSPVSADTPASPVVVGLCFMHVPRRSLRLHPYLPYDTRLRYRVHTTARLSCLPGELNLCRYD